MLPATDDSRSDFILIDRTIGTRAAYAMAAFDSAKAHAITASPYMGTDSLEPFLKDKSKVGPPDGLSREDLHDQYLNLVC